MSTVRSFFEGLGKQARAEIVAKSVRQVGVNGQTWPRKVIPNGSPLGTDRSSEGIFGRFRRAKVKALSNGFEITPPGGPLSDIIFHTGRGGQVARPYIGLSRAQVDRFTKETLKFLQAEAKRLGLT
jgi:hypothetical protein